MAVLVKSGLVLHAAQFKFRDSDYFMNQCWFCEFSLSGYVFMYNIHVEVLTSSKNNILHAKVACIFETQVKGAFDR
jgi:hypothetical protein